MGWLLLGIAVALLSLVVLAVVLLSVWRRTKALMRAVAAAGEALAPGNEALERAQAAGPLGREERPADTRPTPARSPQVGARRRGGVA